MSRHASRARREGDGASCPDQGGLDADLPHLAGEYRRRRPHETVLYQVIRENYLTFLRLREEEGRPLPGFVRREFENFMACGDLGEGFARIHCGSCGYDRLVAYSCKTRSLCPSCAGRRMSEGSIFLADHLIGETPVRHWVLSLPRPLRYLLAYDAKVLGEVVGAFIGAVFQFLRWKAKRVLGLRSVSLAHPGAVTVIGRCSSDMGLNIHLHTLATDGVFTRDEKDQSVSFHALPAPTDREVTGVAWETCRRTLDLLARRGYWEEDQCGLAQDEAVPHPLADIYSASVHVRGVLLMGPRRGQRVVRFHGEAARCQGETRDLGPTGEAFNLHAGQAVRAGDRAALARLARYILRPVLGRARLSRRSDGGVAVWFKARWRDGTAGTVFEPLEFLARLSALVWQRGVNTIRFHGVYAAHARPSLTVGPQGQ